MGYEFVVVFQGNVEQFEKTVSSITGQITDEDRITVIGTGSLSEVKSLKALKKNKKAVRNLWFSCMRATGSVLILSGRLQKFTADIYLRSYL